MVSIGFNTFMKESFGSFPTVLESLQKCYYYLVTKVLNLYKWRSFTKSMLENILPRIDSHKREVIIKILDDLLSTKILSGYNLYPSPMSCKRIVAVSHSHETEAYRQEMVADLINLGYTKQKIEESIRSKYACIRWEKDFVFRDNQGNLFPHLKIRTNKSDYLDLSKYAQSTLEGVPELADIPLFEENLGWQLDLEFNGESELVSLVNLFGLRASRAKENHWVDAHTIPFLIVGNEVRKYTHPALNQLVKATFMILEENGNEVSFVINKTMDKLKAIDAYGLLCRLSFKESVCYGSKQFIDAYVDK
jgi:hypothetical protein